MSAHIVLTSHPRRDASSLDIHWGAPSAVERGPLVASLTNAAHRNVIGSHSGAYAVYRALAVASGTLQRDHRPDLTNTAPAVPIGPHPQWADPDRIVSLDPWGHMVAQCSDGVGTSTAKIDMNRVATVRRDVPVAQHHVL